MDAELWQHTFEVSRCGTSGGTNARLPLRTSSMEGWQARHQSLAKAGGSACSAP